MLFFLTLDSGNGGSLPQQMPEASGAGRSEPRVMNEAGLGWRLVLKSHRRALQRERSRMHRFRPGCRTLAPAAPGPRKVGSLLRDLVQARFLRLRPEVPPFLGGLLPTLLRASLEGNLLAPITLSGSDPPPTTFQSQGIWALGASWMSLRLGRRGLFQSQLAS